MQNTNKKSASHVYDYVIIGSGLGGLCVASALNKLTDNILLVESGDFFGGHSRPITTPAGIATNGLRFLPSTALAKKSIAFLELLLNQDLNPTEIEAPAVTYEGGSIIPFVGFGENPPAFYEDISYFSAQKSLQITVPVHEWAQLLFNKFTGDFWPRSYVTKVLVDKESNRSTGVIINGQKTVHANNVIYSGPVKALKTLVGDEAMGAKAISKLSRGPYWTAVCLDLLHNKPVTDLESIHILNGTTQDDIGPCAGRFLPAVTNDTESVQYSQWITFVADEDTEDTENIGASLKKIKRQIKRAYPNALDDLKYERILVVPSYSGNGELKLNADGTLPKVENMWILSGTMNNQKNLLGSLLQAEFIASALACHPLGSVLENSLAVNTELQTEASL